MKNLHLRLTGVLLVWSIVLPPVLGADISGEDAVLRVVKQYEQAVLNQDVGLAVDVFNSDGSWLAQGRPAAVGKKDIRAALEEFWADVPKFSSFMIQPVKVDVVEDRAAVRADVFVNVTPDATETPLTKALFVLSREADSWGIAHYMFNSNSDGQED